ICQNCGTTNNEINTRICRNCGALLPVSSRTPRVRRQKSSTEKKKKQKTTKQPKQKPIKKEEKLEDKLELDEIPKENEIIDKDIELHEIPTTKQEEIQTPEETKSTILQEIPAQPFKGSIINSQSSIKKPPSLPTPTPRSANAISDAFSELKNSVLEDQKKEQEIPLSPIPSETSVSEESIRKRNQLEKDMTEVLGFLSKKIKISVKKLEIPKAKTKQKEEPKEEIPPSSMNEILKRLITLDLNIEASAIIKTDGTILASAISSRISDSLFATIAMNLSMIGTDIIEGLGAGTLKSISLKATEGVLDLAPIDKENPSVEDMFLILFSHPKVKSGIISFAVSIVKKQIKDYLGLKK
ncbi:MAG: hypothetical protein KAT57_07535, partial [Candidatus Lokiarchaeota archaeon]|nr:hypothetical protein [Candidatus Lokiarchaeota archaeon]